MAQARKPKEQYRTIVHTWRARHVLSFMFPLLWEVLRGKDHKTKRLIARNLRAWSHSLFEVFITMSITLKLRERVNKRGSPKHMMGETSRALQVCRIVMQCSFGFVLCHRDSPIICLGEHLFTFFHFEKILDILMNTSDKERLRALNLRANSFVVLWSLPQSNSHD